MSNAETPAEQTGGNAAQPAAAETLAAIPPRVRVHALAKLLGRTSKDVLATLGELGESTRSAQSSVSREVAQRVAEQYGMSTGQPAASAAPEAPVAAAPPQEADVPAGPVQPKAPVFAPPTPMFLPPEPAAAQPADAKSGGKPPAAEASPAAPEKDATTEAPGDEDSGKGDEDDGDDAGQRRRRRRGRRGRGRGKGADDARDDTEDGDEPTEKGAGQQAKDGGEGKEGADQADDNAQQDEGDDSGEDSSSRRRRRRRRRKGGGADDSNDPGDPPNTVVHVRDSGRAEARDQVRSVRGSTRLEAKRQRRRDGREAGRRRAPILSESEFLARRESVERTMIVKENNASSDRMTQIGVLEDGVLVEHFVTSSGSGSLVGNVYLGRVQNVLPSMEAAFVDIGRGRNAVLYAGEVDWDAAGLEGKSRKIEQALSTGDLVTVQVTKDPVGHKGARLTTQISLPGRFLVYVPGGGATGISRKLPENERRRLKDILKRIVTEDAGVIIRTASEGISEEELERDVRRLQSQWETIKDRSEKGTAKGKQGGPTLLYEEPDLLVKVVRDLFTEDFTKLVVQGSVAWETIDSYVQSVAPDLAERLERYVGNGDVFHDYRIDEQITKALDRKVWLPSGGYLVIDRTEAMTVIDVNTGKFTGSGGNLEETVTRNNLESAEEIVRQLRLRDIGGIIVIDFIDMVLESNRDLVLRRLTECLSRDRTRHQVAEVTSLGLVQMTRKRVGTGLLEAFSVPCEHCKGRGVVVSTEPQQGGSSGSGGFGGGQQQGRKRGRGKQDEPVSVVPEPTPEQRESVVSAVAAMASASKVAPPKEPAAQSESKTETKPEAEAEATPKAEDKSKAKEKATPKAEDKSKSEAGGEPGVSEPAANGRVAHSDERQRQAAPAEQAAVVQEPVQPPAEQPQEGDGAKAAPAVRAVRRRPRRAASRPAGPPVGAGSVSDSDAGTPPV